MSHYESLSSVKRYNMKNFSAIVSKINYILLSCVLKVIPNVQTITEKSVILCSPMIPHSSTVSSNLEIERPKPKVEPSPAMFVVAEASVLKETSGHFHPCLWQPKLDIFPRKFGHVKQFSWRQQLVFWRGPHDIHSCLYDKSGYFEGNLEHFRWCLWWPEEV